MPDGAGDVMAAGRGSGWNPGCGRLLYWGPSGEAGRIDVDVMGIGRVTAGEVSDATYRLGRGDETSAPRR